MFDLWKTLLGRKKKKTEHQMFLEFMARAKESLNSDMDMAMFRYLEEIYKFAVACQKKEEKKKTKVSFWVSDDYGLDKLKRLEEEGEKNKLPHPVEK